MIPHPPPDADERLTNHELNLELAAKRLSAVRKPKACNCCTGLTLATVGRMHLRQPKIGTRGVILSGGISTKADAIAAVDLAAELEGDGELTDHLLTSLRAFLEID